MLLFNQFRYLLFFIFLFTNTVFSQIRISDGAEKYNLQFKILESELNVGKYIQRNADSLGFRTYNGKTIPKKLPNENRMLTLRCEFTIDSLLKIKDLALIIPPIFYASNIYVNGLLLAKRGNTDDGYTNRIHYTEFYLLPSGLLHYQNSKPNEIAIELLTKYGEHNAVNGIFISSRKIASSYTFWRNTFSISFVRGMSVSSVLIFFYVLIFYLIRRNKKYSYYLPFAFVCLLYTTSFINNIISFDYSNNYLLEIVTRISFNLWTFINFYYFLEYTRVLKHKKIVSIVISILLLISSVLIAIQKDVQSVIDFYTLYGATSNLVIDLLLFYCSILYLIRKPSIKSLILFCSIFITILAILHDMYYFVVLLQKPFFALIPYATFIIIVTFFFILTWEQTDVYRLAEQKTVELEELNKNLETIVAERTAKVIESEHQFRTIFENSVDAVFLTDYNGKYVTVNPSYSKITGYPLDYFKDKSTGFITHPNDLNRVKTLFKNLINNEISEFSDELQIEISNGSYIWIELHVTVSLNTKNEFEYILGSFNEITERKKAEQAIKDSETMLKEINNSKDIFMSILAHDLRSPFNSLLGFSNLLLKNLHRYDSQTIENQLTIINKTAQNTFNLLEDLLLWSKSQSGRLPFDPQTIELKIVAQYVIQQLIKQAENKKIKINCLEIENIELIADLFMLKTIFRNLITNAIKFTPENGIINVVATKNTDNVLVTVSDNGIGISPENQAKLWVITQQFITKGTADESGTGLGLLLCKEFVEKHKGKIRVESQVGKGSDFKFTIPVL